jgi:hypothetical protein
MISRRAFAVSLAASPVFLTACQEDPQAAPPPTPTWRLAVPAPYAVQEIYPVLHRAEIWIAGGLSPLARGATERVIVLNPETGAWRDGPALPTPSHHVHLACLNDELYAIGGFLGGDSRTRWICTPRVLKLEGDRWVPGPNLPKPIGEAVPVAENGRIHLIGGRSPKSGDNSNWQDHDDVGDHFVLEAGSTSWRRAAPLPTPRNSAAGVFRNGAIHVISGRNVIGGQSPAHDIYNPETDTWSVGAPYPEPRGGLAAAELGGEIFVGGGEIFNPPSVGGNLWKYDANGAWTQAYMMPTPRHGHGFVTVDSAIYMLGGARNVSSDGTLANVDVLAP